MMKRIMILAVCVMLCAICCLGCHRADIPESTVGEQVKPSAPAAMEDNQETQNVPEETEQPEKADGATEPAESQNPENETTAPVSGGENDQQTNDNQASVDGKLTYEAYNAMSAEEQQAFYLSFADPQDFFDWYNAAKEDHEKNNGNIIIGEDGVIDLEDLFGGNEG